MGKTFIDDISDNHDHYKQIEEALDHDHDHDHDHHHNDGSSCQAHSHDFTSHHNHGRAPVIAYFVGLILAVVALFLPQHFLLLKNTLFGIASIAAGYHVVMLEGMQDTISRTKRNRSFTPNSHVLMGLAALGASILGNFWEGTLLILIFAGAHFLEDYAEGHSKREITKLVALNPTTARLVNQENEVEIVEVSELKVGDKVQVLNGDQVPIDGVILSGNTAINESAINGESIPQEKTVGDDVYASTLNGSGSFTMEVTRRAGDTVFAKILELVNQNQSNQTQVATKIQKYEPKYVKFVLIVIPILIVLGPLLFNWTWLESFYRGLIMLVGASPCALAAATISATLSTTSTLARNGVLSKGSHYLAQLADIKAIAFDKTGTLTEGKPQVTDYYFTDTANQEQLIDILIALEKESNHPLADAILAHFTAQNTLDIAVTNQIGQGLSGQFDEKLYRIGKPTSFMNVANKLEDLNQQWSKEGKTVVYLAENEDVKGIIALMDIPKAEAKGAIDYFKEVGVHTVLITGDSKITGEAVGQTLGLDQVLANVMPEEKSETISQQQTQHGLTAMVGDGVNDAPALVKADVGIAMGDGTDIAVEVSDLALMQGNLSNLVNAHKLARKMNRIIWQNIIFSMSVVVFLITVALLGLSDMTLSVIIHEGSTLVVILNGLRLLRTIK